MQMWNSSNAQQLKTGCEIVNDVHSKLNRTEITKRFCAENFLQVQAAVKQARRAKQSISIAGGRHAMGGQQFLKDGLLLDTSSLNRVINFERESGVLEVESGILWPNLINYLQESQANDSPTVWTIAQKQTGCNQLSVGGALSANIHGRGLRMAPLVQDVEEFTLVRESGDLIRCSRDENSELFRLVIGGYGLFGIIASVKLKLIPKTVLQRHVELTNSFEAVSKLEHYSNSGATYGDFQFAIDGKSNDFLKKGILSTYFPTDAQDDQAGKRRLLSTADWQQLLYLAHTQKTEAFEKYAQYYLNTNGQLYSSDAFQLATYIDNYHDEIDQKLNRKTCGSELISELYVPRQSLHSFLSDAAELLREQEADVIYGTVRLIEKDTQTFMPWAKQSWACTVLNLHVDHDAPGIDKARKAFRGLIDLSISYGGAYYLTYHRFASKQQVLACYPEMPEFLDCKLKYDPLQIFSSNWYQHMQDLFS